MKRNTYNQSDFPAEKAINHIHLISSGFSTVSSRDCYCIQCEQRNVSVTSQNSMEQGGAPPVINGL